MFSMERHVLFILLLQGLWVPGCVSTYTYLGRDLFYNQWGCAWVQLELSIVGRMDLRSASAVGFWVRVGCHKLLYAGSESCLLPFPTGPFSWSSFSLCAPISSTACLAWVTAFAHLAASSWRRISGSTNFRRWSSCLVPQGSTDLFPVEHGPAMSACWSPAFGVHFSHVVRDGQTAHTDVSRDYERVIYSHVLVHLNSSSRLEIKIN